jgi:hypothetical protein
LSFLLVLTLSVKADFFGDIGDWFEGAANDTGDWFTTAYDDTSSYISHNPGFRMFQFDLPWSL